MVGPGVESWRKCVSEATTHQPSPNSGNGYAWGQAVLGSGLLCYGCGLLCGLSGWAMLSIRSHLFRVLGVTSGVQCASAVPEVRDVGCADGLLAQSLRWLACWSVGV